MSDYIYNPESGELYHYGVKGMKWGVRKKREESADVARARSAMNAAKGVRNEARSTNRRANLEANRAFSEAYNKNGIHITKKGRERNQQRWERSYETAKAAEQTKKDYKQAKKDYKQAKRDFNEARERDKFKQYGLDYDNPNHVINAYNMGFKSAQRIQKRMDKTGMSDFSASMIESGRNAALGTLTAYGAMLTIGLVGAAVSKSK